MFWILTYYANASFSFNNLTLIAYRLNRRSYFHVNPPSHVSLDFALFQDGLIPHAHKDTPYILSSVFKYCKQKFHVGSGRYFYVLFTAHKEMNVSVGFSFNKHCVIRYLFFIFIVDIEICL